ncbi:MAG: hypothetical protein ACTHOE_04910 [Conexibacter sp.]
MRRVRKRMSATLVLLSIDPDTGKAEQDGATLYFVDHPTHPAVKRAHWYGTRWQAREPGRRAFQVHRRA